METASRYRTLVVEDEPIWRSTFADLIERSDAFEVAFMASTVAEATEAIAGHRFDAALIDIGLPDGTGVDLVARLAGRQSTMAAAICTVFEDERSVLDAIRAGASGYILKQDAADDLVAMLSHMMEGGAPLSPRVARHILNQFVPALVPALAPSHDAFTARELEVLRSVADGSTLKQTGAALGIAESTVRTHIKNLYSKLGVNNRGNAVLEASRRRLV